MRSDPRSSLNSAIALILRRLNDIETGKTKKKEKKDFPYIRSFFIGFFLSGSAQAGFVFIFLQGRYIGSSSCEKRRHVREVPRMDAAAPTNTVRWSRIITV